MVTEGVELATCRRLSVEPRLRHEPVDEHDDAVGKGQSVGPQQARNRASSNERSDDGGREQRVLPRGSGVEGRVAHACLPEERHREVVEREPDEEREQRDAREGSGHVVATSVMPRL